MVRLPSPKPCANLLIDDFVFVLSVSLPLSVTALKALYDRTMDIAFQHQAVRGPAGTTGHPELGQELSFGDALKAHASPGSHHHASSSSGVLLSDLIEEHGPLAATAMASPTHTSTFVLPPTQTSPAQLAGLAAESTSNPSSYTWSTNQLTDSAAQPLALTNAAASAGIPAGDLMTFQIDGQIKLGLRPRQLTFSGSAQQQPQLGPQLHAGAGLLPTAEHPPALLPHAGHAELSPVPLLPSHAASDASKVFTDTAAADAPAEADPQQLELAQQAAPATGSPHQQGSFGLSSQPVTVVTETEATREAAESQTGQQLSAVAPSLSWPQAPFRQSSALPAPASRQSSGLPPPLPVSRQNSGMPPLPAVVTVPSRQASAVATAPVQQQSGALSRQPSQQQSISLSRQASIAPHTASRQGSGMPLPLSRQPSAPTEAAGRSTEAEEPGQAVPKGPGLGLEQAWADLLPSLLAEASRQHSSGSAVLPSAAVLPATLQPPAASTNPQTVQDVLDMWAPVTKPMGAGKMTPVGPCKSGKPCLCTWLCLAVMITLCSSTAMNGHKQDLFLVVILSELSQSVLLHSRQASAYPHSAQEQCDSVHSIYNLLLPLFSSSCSIAHACHCSKLSPHRWCIPLQEPLLLTAAYGGVSGPVQHASQLLKAMRLHSPPEPVAQPARPHHARHLSPPQRYALHPTRTTPNQVQVRFTQSCLAVAVLKR